MQRLVSIRQIPVIQTGGIREAVGGSNSISQIDLIKRDAAMAVRELARVAHGKAMVCLIKRDERILSLGKSQY